MADIAYSVEAEASVACAGWTRRLYPSANGAAVVASPDGGVDVVVAGVRLGLRRNVGDADGGGGGCRLVASLADQPGAAVVVGRAPADPPPPPPPLAEGEADGEGEGAIPDATPETPVSEETPAEEDDENKTEETPSETKPEKPVYVQFTSDSGLCVTATTERVVLQSRVDARNLSASSAAGARPASLPGSIDVDADVETVRAILPDGSTVRHTRDGGKEVLRLDGNVAKRDVQNGAWIGTNSSGIRWAQRDSYVYVPPPPSPEEEGEEEKANAEANETDEASEETTEPTSGPTEVPLRAGDVVTPPPTFVAPLSAATVIDPETRAKVTSREDLTLVVEHPDEEASGSRSLAVHADGTRVCRDVPAGCAWRVEKEGFAPTHADAVTKDIAADLGVGCVSVDADGVACATFGVNGSLGAVCADVTGLVAFVPGDDREGNTGDDRQTPLIRAKRALRAAATPEGERRGVGDVGAGDPDVDGAFIFDLRRGALRFVDEAARRKEIGFVPFRKSGKENASLPEAEPSVGGASVATDDGLGPSASRACVGDDDDADPELKPATPAAFVARAHEFRAACAFAELDPPPPPEEPEEGTEEGEEGGADEQRNAAGDDAGEDEKTPSPEEAAADATAASPGDGEKSPVAAEPSSTTTATLATTVVVDEPPTRVVVNAPLVPPRVFVAYPDQNEYFEVLSEAAFSSYRAERLNDASCAADAAPVAGAEAGSGR
jgi:hypothetical protein